VLFISVKKVRSHIYMWVIGISQVSEQSCTCVLLVSVWKLSSHVHVCYWFHVILNYYLIKCFICLLWYDLIIQQFSNLGPPWSWSYGDWIYNYLCNQCLFPLTLWFWIPLSWYVLDTTLCDKVCQWFAAGLWFSPSTPVWPPRYNWNIVEPYPPQICQHSFLLSDGNFHLRFQISIKIT
jgi:hypothetical protein